MKNSLKTVCFFICLGLCFVAYGANSINYEVTGLEGAPLTNAENRLKIETQSKTKLTPDTIQKLYANGAENIRKAIEPYGYFRATIKTIRLLRNKNKWTAAYHVTPGEPLRITRIYIKAIGPGKNDKRVLKALKKLDVKVNDVFNVEKYKAAQSALLYAAHKAGYIKAKLVENDVKVNLVTYTCRMDIVLDTKLRYYFGGTIFSKNPLSDKFLRRYLTYKPGDVFSSKKLLSLENTLNSAGYYRGVSVLPELNKIKNRHVPVRIDLTPYKRERYQIGLGYGTASGPRVSGGVKWRWVNRYGHKFSTDFIASRTDSHLQAQYIIPGSDPAKDQYALNAGYFTLFPRNGQATVEKIGASYITKSGHWQQTFNLSYVLERFRLQKHLAFQNAQMLMPNYTLNWQDVRNVIRVKNGSRITFILSGASKDALSTVSFLQTEVRFKTIHTFFENNRLILRIDLGYTAVRDFNKLPLSEQFYTGGPNSVRGYPSEHIGPGRYLTVGSLEYQRRVYGNFYGAIFYDAGSAFNDSSDYRKMLRRSAGPGIVWLSPVGDISVYVAKALTSKGQPYRFEFSLGAEL